MKYFFNKLKTNILFFYLFLLIPAFFLVCITWFLSVDGKLYRCTDTVPILDFFPPFVHGLQFNDYFIAPKSEVYATWHFFIVNIFAVALLMLVFLKKKYKVLYGVFGLFLTGFIIFIGEGFANSTSLAPGLSPSLNNKQAQYRIYKQGLNYIVIYQEKGKDGEMLFVGNSKVPLDSFVYGTDVHIVGEDNKDGRPVSSDKQCIVGVCHLLFNQENVSAAVVNIEKVEKL